MILDPKAAAEVILRRYGLRPAIGDAGAGRARAFQRVGRRRTLQEMKAVAAAAEGEGAAALKDVLASLHADGIQALAAQGVLRHQAKPGSDLARRVRRAMADLRVSNPAGGAPRNDRAIVVAAAAVMEIERARGRSIGWRPGDAQGVMGVVAEVFRRLEIMADARAAVAVITARHKV